MIEPNFNLFLWIIFLTYGLQGILLIVAGALGSKKSETYGIGDVLGGLVAILVCFFVCIL